MELTQKQKFKLFPWTKDINNSLQKSFTKDKNVALCIDEIISNSGDELCKLLEDKDYERGNYLIQVCQDYSVHFHLQKFIKSEDKNLKFAVTRFLACLVDLYIRLSQEDADSSFVACVTQNLNLYLGRGNSRIWDVLLYCDYLKKKYSTVCYPILKCLLDVPVIEMLSSQDFMKYILLLRLWKVFSSGDDVNDIVSLASCIKVASGLPNYLIASFDMKIDSQIPQHKLIKMLLCKKLPSEFFKNCKMLLRDEIKGSLSPQSEPSEEKRVGLFGEENADIDENEETQNGYNINMLNLPSAGFENAEPGEGDIDGFFFIDTRNNNDQLEAPSTNSVKEKSEDIDVADTVPSSSKNKKKRKLENQELDVEFGEKDATSLAISKKKKKRKKKAKTESTTNIVELESHPVELAFDVLSSKKVQSLTDKRADDSNNTEMIEDVIPSLVEVPSEQLKRKKSKKKKHTLVDTKDTEDIEMFSPVCGVDQAVTETKSMKSMEDGSNLDNVPFKDVKGPEVILSSKKKKKLMSADSCEIVIPELDEKTLTPKKRKKSVELLNVSTDKESDQFDGIEDVTLLDGVQDSQNDGSKILSSKKKKHKGLKSVDDNGPAQETVDIVDTNDDVCHPNVSLTPRKSKKKKASDYFGVESITSDKKLDDSQRALMVDIEEQDSSKNDSTICKDDDDSKILLSSKKKKKRKSKHKTSMSVNNTENLVQNPIDTVVIDDDMVVPSCDISLTPKKSLKLHDSSVGKKSDQSFGDSHDEDIEDVTPQDSHTPKSHLSTSQDEDVMIVDVDDISDVTNRKDSSPKLGSNKKSKRKRSSHSDKSSMSESLDDSYTNTPVDTKKTHKKKKRGSSEVRTADEESSNKQSEGDIVCNETMQTTDTKEVILVNKDCEDIYLKVSTSPLKVPSLGADTMNIMSRNVVEEITVVETRENKKDSTSKRKHDIIDDDAEDVWISFIENDGMVTMVEDAMDINICEEEMSSEKHSSPKKISKQISSVGDETTITLEVINIGICEEQTTCEKLDSPKKMGKQKISSPDDETAITLEVINIEDKKNTTELVGKQKDQSHNSSMDVVEASSAEDMSDGLSYLNAKEMSPTKKQHAESGNPKSLIIEDIQVVADNTSDEECLNNMLDEISDDLNLFEELKNGDETVSDSPSETLNKDFNGTKSPELPVDCTLASPVKEVLQSSQNEGSRVETESNDAVAKNASDVTITKLPTNHVSQPVVLVKDLKAHEYFAGGVQTSNRSLNEILADVMSASPNKNATDVLFTDNEESYSDDVAGVQAAVANIVKAASNQSSLISRLIKSPQKSSESLLSQNKSEPDHSNPLVMKTPVVILRNISNNQKQDSDDDFLNIRPLVIDESVTSSPRKYESALQVPGVDVDITNTTDSLPIGKQLRSSSKADKKPGDESTSGSAVSSNRSSPQNIRKSYRLRSREPSVSDSEFHTLNSSDSEMSEMNEDISKKSKKILATPSKTENANGDAETLSLRRSSRRRLTSEDSDIVFSSQPSTRSKKERTPSRSSSVSSIQTRSTRRTSPGLNLSLSSLNYESDSDSQSSGGEECRTTRYRKKIPTLKDIAEVAESPPMSPSRRGYNLRKKQKDDN